MARCEVVQVRCDRCKRVQLVAPQGNKTQPDFEARMVGPDGTELVIRFDDTCPSCKTALVTIWDQIKEWARELKQPFGPTVSENKAPPLTPAPDYTPPKPHSLAAAQKK